jgi:ABC-type transporter Mla MlaB component
MSKKTKTIELQGDLTIVTAAETHKLLCSAIEENLDLAIHFNDIGSADLTFMQLLSATRHSAEQKGITVELMPPLPDVLIQLSEEAGTTDLIKTIS